MVLSSSDFAATLTDLEATDGVGGGGGDMDSTLKSTVLGSVVIGGGPASLFASLDTGSL